MSRILTVNAGSSSLKLALLDGTDRAVIEQTVPSAGRGTDEPVLRDILSGAGSVDAVGHRIVHGGTEFTGPVVVDETVIARLAGLAHLAPLHQARSLDALKLVTMSLPHVPAVACFDTAFHAHLPLPASTFALPREWSQKWGLRRFGFHGLSHAYTTRTAAGLLGRDLAGLRVVSCHLGAGASLAAVQGGRSVATTMGFTPLDGLVMATRSGSVDPGLLLWLLTDGGVPLAELGRVLEERSGLLGLAGTADMREVVARAVGGDEWAALGLDVYLHHLRAAIATMAAAMGGLDVLVFTGGVGQNSAAVRSRSADQLGFLGVFVDADRNDNGPPDRRISPDRAPVAVLVVVAHEDREMAHQVRDLLGL